MTTTDYAWTYVTREDMLDTERGLPSGLRSIYTLQPLHEEELLIRLDRAGVACLLHVSPAAELGTWDCNLWRVETNEEETAGLALQIVRATEPACSHLSLDEKEEWSLAHSQREPRLGPTRYGLAVCMMHAFVREMTTVIYRRRKA